MNRTDRVTIILLIAFFLNLNPATFVAYCQEPPPAGTEQHLENLTDASQAELQDDSFLQSWEQFKKNPLNLNTAEENDLQELKILTALQIESFLLYRKLFGKFISIYELQAIPAWDIITIKKLLPFIWVGDITNVKEEFYKRIKNGNHHLLLRISQEIEKLIGTEDSGYTKTWLGSPQKIFFRYRYDYKKLLQFGISGDKDAGEQFFKGEQNKGFDFYSFHLFAREQGAVQSFALGDFTVNMGQGLIQWQSLAFRKGADVTNIKFQSPILQPYHSAGEFNFHRGIGLTARKGKMEITAFISSRKLDANIIQDSVNQLTFFSSFQYSGYHRTSTENADRNKLHQLAFGGNMRYKHNRFQIGFNAIQFNFSIPLQKRNEPYNLFEINGKSWSNVSVDYSYTYRNLHVFGEVAADKNFKIAYLNGIMISVDPRVDISILQRAINPEYRALCGNAFTENTQPANEQGLFTGLTIRPFDGWKIDAYMDIFKFPWLRFGVDAPSRGNDLFIQLMVTPGKQVELYTRFHNETKQFNKPGNTGYINQLISVPRKNWRFQFGYKFSTTLSIRSRVEMVWYNKKGETAEQGFLYFFDLFFKPAFKSYSGNLRLQYFESDGYNSRIYAYENDVLYSFSIPSFSERGLRYYVNLRYGLNEKISFWFKWSQTLLNNLQKPDFYAGGEPVSRKSEMKILIRVNF